jgi:serine/threonine protein kinase
MQTADFLKIRALFERVLKLPSHEQDAFLAQECGSDEALLAELRELRAAHLAASYSQPSTKTTGPAADENMIGPYRLRGPLGEGGMGIVFLALRDDGAFRKSVALKILRRDQCTPDLLERFQQERQVVANLDHPNIARILDGGQTPDGLPYYVMEYVEGMPLDKYCDQRKLDLEGRVRVFIQICEAVQYLHEHLVVHRDLKPSNILVTPQGTAKLLDFGIAKQQIPAANAGLTAVQGRMMTPGYASPEQFSGAPVTGASDIYTLGVILYLLLTGTLPHPIPGDKLTQEPELPSSKIREDIQRTPETTSELRRRIVGDLDHVVMMCLRRDPRNRYESAGQLAADLRNFLESRPVVARRGPFLERVTRFVKRNRLAVAACALILLLGGFGGWQMVEARLQARHVAELSRLLDNVEKTNAAKASASDLLDYVKKFREALARDLTPTGKTLTALQQTLLQRGMKFLEKVRPAAENDPKLAIEVAAAWKQVGILYQPVNSSLAQTAFKRAEVVVEAAPAQEAERIAPIERRPAAPSPARSAAVAVSTEIAAPETPPPVVATSRPAAMDAAGYEQYSARLAPVRSLTATADETMALLRQSSRKLGAAVHPEIEARYARMRLALEAAERDAAAGDFPSANENLAIAKALADKVLKDGGR